jgi:hypothetical protein
MLSCFYYHRKKIKKSECLHLIHLNIHEVQVHLLMYKHIDLNLMFQDQIE